MGVCIAIVILARINNHFSMYIVYVLLLNIDWSILVDYGQERSMSLANKNSEQVLESLETLVMAGGK